MGAVRLRIAAEGTHWTYLASEGQLPYKLIESLVNNSKKWSCHSENSAIFQLRCAHVKKDTSPSTGSNRSWRESSRHVKF